MAIDSGKHSQTVLKRVSNGKTLSKIPPSEFMELLRRQVGYNGRGKEMTVVWIPIGPIGSNPMFIYPVSEWIKGINILRIWQKSHIDPLTWRVRAIVIKKAKLKSLVMYLPRKMVNWKQYRIFRITAKISATIKYLKDEGVLVPNTYPFHYVHVQSLINILTLLKLHWKYQADLMGLGSSW